MARKPVKPNAQTPKLEPGSNINDAATDAATLAEAIRLFVRNENPIFAWAAIEIFLEMNLNNEEKIPKELREFLLHTSKAIVNEAQQVNLGKRTPDAAALALPNRLGIVRRGWNAFHDLQRMVEPIGTAEVYGLAREAGLSHEAAIERIIPAIKKVEGIELEPRGVSRRLRRKRDVWD